PLPGHNADLLLDLGSTTTKLVLRVEGRASVVRDEETTVLTKNWGIEAYRKADLVSDPSGERWCDWMVRVLPALRRWVGQEHNAYLRNVYVALPATASFDVKRLANDLANESAPGTAQLLLAATAEHLVANGRVVLKPEHELVAAHYLDVLRILQRAAKEYTERSKKWRKKIKAQTSKQREHDQKAHKHNEYKDKFFVIRWFTPEPERPSGSRPVVDPDIAAPEDWMWRLIAHPEELDHVVLLDAGGLSLDVSVLEKQKKEKKQIPVAELGYSDADCGGEAISARIDRHEIGDRGTRHKAQLGRAWRDMPDLLDPPQREYRDVSRRLYERPIRLVFKNLGERWKSARDCTVLLTGGGSRNPHFAEFVGEVASEFGLAATVVDARVVQKLIQAAREFPEPLHDLDAVCVRNFEEVQRWSETRERNEYARYDKFSVVGGMVTLGDGGTPL
ncbi:MAG: hypothetical protein ACYCOU_19385, partial [Sulfobacillus sp.]